MSTVQLSDVQFDEDVYTSYVRENRPDRNAFVASGVAVTNALLNARAAGQGDLTTIPYWKDLDIDSENISSDDPSEYATPDKISTGKMVARNAHINNAWQTANLVADVMGTEDPMMEISGKTASYWENRFEARIQATARILCSQTRILLEEPCNSSTKSWVQCHDKTRTHRCTALLKPETLSVFDRHQFFPNG